MGKHKSKSSDKTSIRTRIENNPKNVIRNKVVNIDPDYVKATGGDANGGNGGPWYPKA
ncbi:hypothetical protein [Paenibacillus dakarensis]|uniref:hypothetical protein n=1 Tax=Paenibacillus dakarensis TaxID=1527293 RepID=UPI000B15B0C4|nr:hypothetical protein [Paenibacillus dakarensis]